MSTERRKPPTMRDVARRAGVSRSLVSTVFRDVPGASPATRQRIMEAAAELGYRPDVRARQLRSRDSHLIGVTLTATHPFHVAIVERLHESAALTGYAIAISLNSEARSLDRAVETLLDQRCAAIVMVGPTAPDDDIAHLAEVAGDVPLIVVDRECAVPTVDAVRIDDAAALMEIVSYLVGQGHRRIWHADGGEYVSAAPRRTAYERAMTAHGLACESHVVCSGGSAMSGAAAAMELIGQPDLPTAIVCYNDRVACGFIDVLWRNGIRVPEDVSIVGFDNIREANMPHMSITTIEQEPESLADAAAELALARIAGAPPGGLRHIAPGPLVVRGSTGGPRPRLERAPLAG